MHGKKRIFKDTFKGNELYACNYSKKSTDRNMHGKKIYFMFESIKLKYCILAKYLL